MADEPKTDVSGNVTPPASATEKTPPHTASDTAGNQTGLDHRIAGLTAERERWKAAAEDAARKLDELKARTMSDQEKALAAAQAQAVDQFKASEYEPVKQRLAQVEEALRAKLDMLKGELREDQLKKIPPGLTVDTELAFVEAIADSPKQRASVGGAISPVGNDSDTRMYSLTEFQEWQRMAASTDPTVRAEWKKMRPQMDKAYREGRVERG